jgi:hypothetical protein
LAVGSLIEKQWSCQDVAQSVRAPAGAPGTVAAFLRPVSRSKIHDRPARTQHELSTNSARTQHELSTERNLAMHAFAQPAALGPSPDGKSAIGAAVNDIQQDISTLSRLSIELARRRAVKKIVPEIAYLAATIAGSVLGVVGIVMLVYAAAWTLAPNPISAMAWSGAVLLLLAVLPPVLHHFRKAED